VSRGGLSLGARTGGGREGPQQSAGAGAAVACAAGFVSAPKNAVRCSVAGRKKAASVNGQSVDGVEQIRPVSWLRRGVWRARTVRARGEEARVARMVECHSALVARSLGRTLRGGRGCRARRGNDVCPSRSAVWCRGSAVATAPPKRASLSGIAAIRASMHARSPYSALAKRYLQRIPNHRSPGEMQ
jgi:hypothetical protein